MRNKDVAIGRQTIFNNYEPLYNPHSSRRSRTCESMARPEGHALHALGEHELVDSACGRKGGERGKV